MRTSYSVWDNQLGQVVLRRQLSAGSDVYIHYTAAAYVAGGSWNKFKIPRGALGEFTTYLNGSAIDTTGGYGTNPSTDNEITSTVYLVIELKSSCKFALHTLSGTPMLKKYTTVV